MEVFENPYKKGFWEEVRNGLILGFMDIDATHKIPKCRDLSNRSHLATLKEGIDLFKRTLENQVENTWDFS